MKIKDFWAKTLKISVEVSFYGHMALTDLSQHCGSKSLLGIDSYLGQNAAKALQEIVLFRLDFRSFFHPSCAFRQVIILFSYDMSQQSEKADFSAFRKTVA